jgi:hypothetical protein
VRETRGERGALLHASMSALEAGGRADGAREASRARRDMGRTLDARRARAMEVGGTVVASPPRPVRATDRGSRHANARR